MTWAPIFNCWDIATQPLVFIPSMIPRGNGCQAITARRRKTAIVMLAMTTICITPNAARYRSTSLSSSAILAHCMSPVANRAIGTPMKPINYCKSATATRWLGSRGACHIAVAARPARRNATRRWRSIFRYRSASGFLTATILPSVVITFMRRFPPVAMDTAA